MRISLLHIRAVTRVATIRGERGQGGGPAAPHTARRGIGGGHHVTLVENGNALFVEKSYQTSTSEEDSETGPCPSCWAGTGSSGIQKRSEIMGFVANMTEMMIKRFSRPRVRSWALRSNTSCCISTVADKIDYNRIRTGGTRLTTGIRVAVENKTRNGKLRRIPLHECIETLGPRFSAGSHAAAERRRGARHAPTERLTKIPQGLSALGVSPTIRAGVDSNPPVAVTRKRAACGRKSMSIVLQAKIFDGPVGGDDGGSKGQVRRPRPGGGFDDGSAIIGRNSRTVTGWIVIVVFWARLTWMREAGWVLGWEAILSRCIPSNAAVDPVTESVGNGSDEGEGDVHVQEERCPSRASRHMVSPASSPSR
ncbi:hypothetical protein DFJ77DRAFT_444032 [Powellomyces hirtus]|nr:hypothetical protein DFJ77DRAFT_444032 [Powellomyces hirtus]